MPDPTFVLLHSPLVGPASWQPVADAIYLHGFQVAVPRIESPDAAYWRGYVDAAVEALRDIDGDEVVLAAHSGAGPLVAAIAADSPLPVAGVVFVDAGLPADGWSRLQEME
ncbi:MAG: alpha/beta hydrolase, partial [Dehalococcoidia bacterium]